MSERPITPVAITLTDGQERKFLLSLGALKRIKERLKLDTLQELLNRDIVDCGIPILWEALLDKADMTEDRLADLLPADVQALIRSIMALLGVSMPESRPTLPPAETPVVN